MAEHSNHIEAPDPYSASGPNGEHFRSQSHQTEADDHGVGISPTIIEPQPHRLQASASEDRLWATIAHLSVFLAPILGPLALFLIFKDTHPRVDKASRAALNFEISLILWGIAFALLAIVLIGIPLLIALGVISIVLPIVAAFRTNRGEDYTYPLSLKVF